jgi:drug/metabolite transporter (DMT)-like permease
MCVGSSKGDCWGARTDRVMGIFWVIASTVTWALWAFVYSRCIQVAGYWATYVAGSVFVSLASYAIVFSGKSPAFPKTWWLYALPAIGFIGSLTQAKAMGYFPPQIVSAVISTSPAFLAIVLACVGNNISTVGWIGIILCISGAVLLATSSTQS